MSVVQYIRRKFDKDGKFVKSELFDPVLTVVDVNTHLDSGSVQPCLIHNDSQLEIMPAAAVTTVEVNLNAEPDLIQQGQFKDKAWRDNATLNFWSGQSSISRQLSGKAQGDSSVFFASRAVESDSMVSLAKKLFAEKNNQLSVRLEWTAAPNLWDPVFIAYQQSFPADPNQDPEKLSFNLRYSIRWAGLYYNVKNKTWDNAPVINKDNAKAEVFGKKTTLDVTTTPLPESVTGEHDAELIIWSPTAQYEEQPDFQSVRVWFYVDNVEMKVLFEGKPPQEEQTLSWQNPNKKYTFIPEEYTIHHADAPDYLSRKTLYPYAWRIAGKLTGEWRRRGYVEKKNLQNLVSDQITRSQDKPQQKINGSLRGRMYVYNVMEHPLNGNRLFSVTSLSFSAKDAEYNGQFYEVLYPIVAYEDYRITQEGELRITESNNLRLLQTSYNGVA